MRGDVQRVRNMVEQIRRADPELAQELEAKAAERAPVRERAARMRGAGPELELPEREPSTERESARKAVIELAGLENEPMSPEDFRLESIVLKAGRPVLAVREGEAVLTFEDAESSVWKGRLTTAGPMLRGPIGAVGRIEVKNHPWFEWVGTGWLIDRGIIVTNRHVAEEFVTRSRGSLRFTIGFDRVNPIDCHIDLLEEIDRPQSQEYVLSEPLYISDDPGPDVAFFRLGPVTGGSVPQPIKLASTVAPDGLQVAAVGYPARDPRVPDQVLLKKIYGDVFNKKRLAPGQVIRHERGVMQHDCTTLGGNSGSVVLDLRNGEAVALHFAGTYLRANYAVPATVLSQLLRDAQRPMPVEIVTADSGAGAPAASAPIGTTTSTFSSPAGAVELQVTLRIGGAPQPGPGASAVTAGAAAAVSTGPVLDRPSREQVREAVEEARRTLGIRPDVVSIRPGYRFRDGWITDERVVVVGVRRKYEREELAGRGLLPLPPAVRGVRIDVTTGTDDEMLQQATSYGAEEAKKWVSNYQPRPALPLTRKERELSFNCHAGPDAGWPVLEPFLERVKKSLVVGMYDFTAPHIIDAVKSAVGPGQRSLTMTLQRHAALTGTTKADDVKEEETIEELQSLMGNRFTFSWASVTGPDRLFDSSYHIKVAVRDRKEFWLSSGNWQSSNQPPHDPLKKDVSPPLLRAYNREWNAVIENPELAGTFEDHLKGDAADAANVPEAIATADLPDLWVSIDYFYPTEPETEAPPRYFAPLVGNRKVEVQPLLTPDNYADVVLEVLESAREKIYFQNQSLTILEEGSNAAKFEALVAALRDKQSGGLDVRIIFRRIGDLREKLTLLKDYGFDMSKLRVQTNCHTKGIVVDSKVVVLGSHNWSNAGTVFNRDASLVFWDEEIARYYE
ncbi:MAG TPA: phospholipase D-like domain-containing protein, partial [Thermoanaerobaculia bacterium]|nr:phospholipase D-like domain-containing protein [Thermoanaerobaculia bacterium]